MATVITIHVPKKRERNPLATFQERRQVFRDRRLRRAKDHKRSWKSEEH